MPRAVIEADDLSFFSRAHRGAYGLRITGLDAGAMLVPAEPDWPQLRIEVSIEDSPLAEERITDDRADLQLRAGGRLEVDREEGLARFVVPRPMTDHELLHPGLAPAAVVMSHWLDRPCFHAGAFVARDGVWAVAGARESGKSSTLAWLALNKHPIVADDILVLDNSGGAYAGPRSIDLREETADRLGAGEPLGQVGTRSRWRVSLLPLPTKLPFRGWFFLEWGDALEVRRLPASDCLSLLLRQRAARIRPLSPASLLELAALPAWELRRPPDWNLFDEAATLLLATTLTE
ncbi:MAG: hypothetical protein QOE13_1930 [Gaiellaceae bacterium]|nr:hypothetical protein [Gaiellaceae bacterium]